MMKSYERFLLVTEREDTLEENGKELEKRCIFARVDWNLVFSFRSNLNVLLNLYIMQKIIRTNEYIVVVQNWWNVKIIHGLLYYLKKYWYLGCVISKKRKKATFWHDFLTISLYPLFILFYLFSLQSNVSAVKSLWESVFKPIYTFQQLEELCQPRHTGRSMSDKAQALHV